MSILYDAGALIAADRSARERWAEHRRLLERGLVPVTTAPIVAQVSRSARQANLRRFLRGCEIAAFAAAEAHDVGTLLSRAGTADVVDAHAVHQAATRGLTVLTSDVDDLRRLAAVAGTLVRVRPV